MRVVGRGEGREGRREEGEGEKGGGEKGGGKDKDVESGCYQLKIRQTFD